MEFLNNGFKLKRGMVDLDGVVEQGGDSYFIPLKIKNVPMCMIDDPSSFDLISEIYILAFYDMSRVELLSQDVLGNIYNEFWSPSNTEINIVRGVILQSN